MTNTLYVLSSPAASPPLLMCRIVNLSAGVDRVREARLLAHVSREAGDLGVCVLATVRIVLSRGTPPLLVRFEHYLYGRTLVRADVRTFAMAPRLARVLARFHALQRSILLELPPPRPALPEQLAHYVEDIRTIAAAVAGAGGGAGGEGASAWAALLGRDWAADVAFVGAAMGSAGGPLVLSHCDAQPGNWIEAVTNGGGAGASSAEVGAGVGAEAGVEAGDGHALYLIDLEYASHQQRGFDLGNTFGELCSDYSLSTAPGFSWDVRSFPSDAWQVAFAEAYIAAAVDGGDCGGSSSPLPLAPPSPAASSAAALSAAATATATAADEPAACDADALERCSCAPSALACASPSHAVRALLREARVGALASHLFWAAWAVVLGAGAEGLWAPPAARLAQVCDDALLAAAGGHAERVATVDVEGEGEAQGGGAGRATDDAAGSAPAAAASVFSYRAYAEARLRAFEAQRGAVAEALGVVVGAQ